MNLNLNNMKTNDFQYPYFCIFCMQQTTWESRELLGGANFSRCLQCGVEGTNYQKDCPNKIKFESNGEETI